MVKQIEHSPLSKPVYETLKAMILNKELKPGEKIVQEKIASQLGVSRTPLMNALQKLEYELFLESIPRRGMFVRNISVQDMIDVYYCRESIECMAVRLATERASKKKIRSLRNIFTVFATPKSEINAEGYQKADEEFHNAIIELSCNPVLEKMSRLSQVPNQVYSIGLLRTPQETLGEHLRIVSAMEKGEADLAEQEMREHIRLSREVLEQKNKQNKF